MMLNPPNTFLSWWKASELRGWLKEALWREGSPSYKERLPAPSSKQVKEEMKRRRMEIE